MSQGGDSQIKINSFYDVFEEYSDEELLKYKHFAGVSVKSKYKEILDKLQKEDAD